MGKIIKIILIIATVIFVFSAAAAGYFYFGKIKISDSINWGVDFSQSQAEYLELEWKELYSGIINDLGAQNIKLHTNWNWVEGRQDIYYFKDIDWQIDQAEKNNVKIIYVLGMKTGRWPECHIPDWAKNLPEQQQQEELVEYITQVVSRYKNSNAIAYWQVENEPFFKFGECPDWYYQNDNFLKAEVDLIRALDPSRKIIISDSGEGSMWFKAGEIGDIIGTTMYRSVWTHITDTVGFKTNYKFLNPTVYAKKAELVGKMFGAKVICIELQAEPWASRPFVELSLDEQYESMNLQIFQENINFAKATGFDTFYFWGVEWWYWLKEKYNQPEIWNEAKALFKDQK